MNKKNNFKYFDEYKSNTRNNKKELVQQSQKKNR
jgi:hypothetical protein